MSERTATTNAEQQTLPVSAALVVVLTAQDAWMPSSCHSLDGVDRLAIRRGTRSVDRGRELVLALPDQRLSAAHGELRLTDGRWYVEDLASKNGVFHNGVPIVGRALLGDGDVLEMGRTFFVFRAQRAPDAIEPLDWTIDSRPASAPGLASMNTALAQRFAQLSRASASALPIVLSGEMGTGKEVTARAVHALSRRPGALVAINCGGLPRSLLESELFGFKRGSFSGALQDRAGLIAASHRGTLFLDEIGELPLDAQAVLLRVLQEREVMAIGATHAQPLDLRVVCASHRSLDAAVASGQFRADLHARLQGFRIVLPPVRERREDLGMIAHALLERLAPDRPLTLSHAAARALFARTWPGNVREIERALQLAITMASCDALEFRDEPTPPARLPAARLRPADRERQTALERLLREHRGNVAAVARSLGKPRELVHRWIKRVGLDSASFRN